MNEVTELSKWMNNWLAKRSINDPGDKDDDITKIYDIVLILAGLEKFETIDLLLRLINPRKIKIQDLISILVATSWFKEKLQNRNKFYKKSKLRLDVILSRNILEGLE